MQCPVEHEQAVVGEGTPQRDRPSSGEIAAGPAGGSPYRRLGRSIEIPDRNPPDLEGPGQLAGKGFATTDDRSQRRWRRRGRLHELAQGRGGLVEQGHPLARQQIVEIPWRLRHLQRRHDEASAGTQRTPDLPDRKVKRAGVKQRPCVVLIVGEDPAGGLDEMGRAAVRDLDPFGPPGRARGIDHVRQVPGRDARVRKGRVPVRGVQLILHADHRRCMLRQG